MSRSPALDANQREHKHSAHADKGRAHPSPRNNDKLHNEERDTRSPPKPGRSRAGPPRLPAPLPAPLVLLHSMKLVLFIQCVISFHINVGQRNRKPQEHSREVFIKAVQAAGSPAGQGPSRTPPSGTATSCTCQSTLFMTQITNFQIKSSCDG